jgi:hypothetical protein
MKTYIYNMLLWLDEGLNVFFVPLFRHLTNLAPAAGGAHYTVSQTLAELRERGSSVGCVGCKILTKVWGLWVKKRPYDHCTDAMAGVPESESVG